MWHVFKHNFNLNIPNDCKALSSSSWCSALVVGERLGDSLLWGKREYAA